MNRNTTNINHITDEGKLRIWQQNINRSLIAQQDLLNMLGNNNYDICAIQEPYLDSMNKTRANSHWTVIYPTTHMVEPKKTRSVILVNKKLSTDKWEELDVDSGDVTGIRIKTDTNTIDAFNIYNNQDNNEAIEKTDEALRRNGNQNLDNQYIWLGNFNRHHPLWDEERNSHLFTELNLRLAQTLLDAIQEWGLQMILPKDIPTLQAFGTGNYTRPDNVFCSAQLADHLVYCNTEPSRKPTNTDHLPIITIWDLEVLKISMAPRPNYQATDWEVFREKLRPRLRRKRTPDTIATTVEFHEYLEHIDNAIQDTITEVVPVTKPCPHAKRWWNDDLSSMRKKLNRLERESYRWRTHSWHPVHEEAKNLQRKYAASIQKTKTNHWCQWLEELNEQTVWEASKMAKGPPSDGRRARVPNLKGKLRGEDEETIARDNSTKAKLFFEEFFPKPPEDDNRQESLQGAARWAGQSISKSQI